MIKENYRAWDIDVQDFSKQKTLRDKLHFLTLFAILAPSSHNSQPWNFKIEDNIIHIMRNEERCLPVSDANHRQEFISIGCALKNLLVAADYYGFDADLVYLPQGPLHADAVDVILKEKNNQGRQFNHLILSILKRHTNRNPYDARLPDTQFLSWILSLNDETMHIDLIKDTPAKNAVADMVVSAMGDAMADTAFRQELSGYMKSNYTHDEIGMPGFGFGMPGPFSMLAPKIVPYINISKLTKRQDESLLKEHTPMFILISTKDDTPLSWIRAGQTYEYIALEAEKHGIKTAILAAAIQIGNYYQGLQHITHTTFRPQVFCRIGYTNVETRHSPRFLIKE